MKTISSILAAIMMVFSLALNAQNEYPEQGTDYTSEIGESSQDGKTVYTFLLENTSNEPIAFYNFKLKDESSDYYIVKDMVSAALVLEPYEKATYFKCKGSTRPGATWNAKFLRYDEVNETYPTKNKDYFFHYKVNDNGYSKTYSYHLMNISDQDIKFSNFSMTDEVSYDIDKDFPIWSETVGPKTDFMAIKFTMDSDDDSPSMNWNADWVEEEADLGNPDLITKNYGFCAGVMKLMESAKNTFEDVRAAKIEGSILFDEYECAAHLEGVNNEVIEYLMFFWEYVGDIGYSADLETIKDRFWEYKSKLKSCLPSSLEETVVTADDDETVILRAKYTGDWNGDTHFVQLDIKEDYSSDGQYRLELIIEEIY